MSAHLVIDGQFDGRITLNGVVLADTGGAGPTPGPTPPGPTPGPSPSPSPSPTPTPPPAGVLPIKNPGQNDYALSTPGVPLCWELMTEFQGEAVVGGEVKFANAPGNTTTSTLYEASISETPGDFTGAVELGASGGNVSWGPPDVGLMEQYGVWIVPRGARRFLNFRLKPGNEGMWASGAGGRAGLTFYWSKLYA